MAGTYKDGKMALERVHISKYNSKRMKEAGSVCRNIGGRFFGFMGKYARTPGSTKKVNISFVKLMHYI